MPKPKSKEELLNQSQSKFRKLISLIDSYPPGIKNKEFASDSMNRNIRDVLTHMHHWHVMTIRWYTEANEGKQPVKPAPGYTWQTLPALNKKINEDYQHYTLTQALFAIQESHDAILHIVRSHSDKELFTKKKYNWTGSTSMGAYFISSASSHYDWGIKIIKNGLK